MTEDPLRSKYDEIVEVELIQPLCEHVRNLIVNATDSYYSTFLEDFNGQMTTSTTSTSSSSSSFTPEQKMLLSAMRESADEDFFTQRTSVCAEALKNYAKNQMTQLCDRALVKMFEMHYTNNEDTQS